MNSTIVFGILGGNKTASLWLPCSSFLHPFYLMLQKHVYTFYSIFNTNFPCVLFSFFCVVVEAPLAAIFQRVSCTYEGGRTCCIEATLTHHHTRSQVLISLHENKTQHTSQLLVALFCCWNEYSLIRISDKLLFI